MKNIQTTRFGEIEIDESRAIHFHDGLPGFQENKDFIILEHKPDSPFQWLQSLTSPELAFIMINPFLIKGNYLEDLSPEEKDLIRVDNDGGIMVFSIVTIPQGQAHKATVNLLGPIVIDSETRNAKQVILANSGYSHRHPIMAA